MRSLTTLAAMAVAAAQALGQTAAPTSVAPAAAAATGDDWAFSVSVFQYHVPDEPDFLLPIVAADRGSLHLEARYNYEAPDTGSLWAGYGFSGGDELTWELTPVFGVVFGDAKGLAPGYEGTLAWRSLELYSEGEYVFDSRGTEESFFYNWSELTVAPAEWVRFGLVTQRTRAYESDRDIQRGLLVGFSFGRADLAAYVFNPDDDEPTVIVSLALEF